MTNFRGVRMRKGGKAKAGAERTNLETLKGHTSETRGSMLRNGKKGKDLLRKNGSFKREDKRGDDTERR